jgi:hypothetical protein
MENNTFLQANLWGIIGTVSGLTGVIISWLTFKYNTPGIEIEKMRLIIPDWAGRDWKGKSIKDLESNVLEFKMEIIVRNKSGGAGSIDKPTLLLNIPDGKKLLLIPKFRTIRISPVTQHQEYQKESDNITKFWTVRHGKAFNLGAGEKSDEELEYEIYRNPQLIHEIVENLENIKYLVEFRDNKGKRHERQIEQVSKESEVER